MGTHNYRLQVTGKYKGGRFSALPFDMLDTNNTNSWSTFDSDNSRIYSRDVGCRERVMDFLRDISSRVFRSDRDDLLVGIRCFGQMHSKVAQIIGESDSNAERVENFLSSMFGMRYKIRVVNLEHENLNRFHLNKKTYSYTVAGQTVTTKLFHVVTLYFQSKNNHAIPLSDCKVSAALAILREPRLISGLLDGSLHDGKTFCREILRLAWARIRGKDDTYDCVTLTSLGNAAPARSTLLDRVSEILKRSNNTDGSDWKSMVYLAMFCYMCFFPPDNMPITTDSSGPASFAENRCTQTQMRELSAFTGVRLITEGIARRSREQQEGVAYEQKIVNAWAKTK